MARRCVSLFSGGLDSILTLALLARQGVDVIAFHGVSVFHEHGDGPEHMAAVREKCLALGAKEVIFRNMNARMIEFTTNPVYGYGSHLNACLDCRVNCIGTAKAILDEIGADFLASGEVIGQRPMSQRKDAMNRVTKIVNGFGLEGLLLRPLSAKLLKPTIPETEGWVDREQLLAFHGRSRKPQMALATALGITDYPSPAGGCLLTDPGFARRMQDLLANHPGFDVDDIRLLRIGRHWRLGPRTKIVVSRNEAEGQALEGIARPNGAFFLTQDRPGALALVAGEVTEEACRIAAGFAVHYSRYREAGAAKLWRWSHHPGFEARVDIGMQKGINPDLHAAAFVGERNN